MKISTQIKNNGKNDQIITENDRNCKRETANFGHTINYIFAENLKVHTLNG